MGCEREYNKEHSLRPDTGLTGLSASGGARVPSSPRAYETPPRPGRNLLRNEEAPLSAAKPPSAPKMNRRPTLASGTRLLNRYEIRRVLGAGGMSTVYLARDLHFPRIERLVAVKEMTIANPRLKEHVLRAFEREAHLLAQLSHPAIPAVYDFFSEGDRAYLVLEYIRGHTLEHLVRTSPHYLPIEKVVQWAIALADVLHYLHTHSQRPIIFRDVKPSNVMITPQEQVKLIDFGIARIFMPSQKGTMIGTEGYAPPEQYRGVLSPLVDIYALGATLHHVLTKHDPRKEPPFSFHERPIRQYNPQVPPELERIVYKALAYKPEERFQSAQAMKVALEAFLQRWKGQAHPPDAPAVADEATSRLSAGPQTEGTAAWDETLAMDIEDITWGGDATQVVPDADTATQAWSEATQVMPPGDPEATRQMSPSPGDATRLMGPGGAPRAASADTVRPAWVFETEDEIRSSARVVGDVVLIGSYDHNVYALDAQKGTLRWKFPTQGGVVSQPASDGRLVFFGSQDGHIYAVRLRDASLVWKIPTGGPVNSSPWLAERMLFVGSDDGYLYAIRADRGQVMWRFAAGAPVRSSPIVADMRVLFGSEDGDFYAVGMNGKEKWRARARRGIYCRPAVGEGAVYFTSVDGHLYAVDLETGWVLQTHRFGRPSIAWPVVAEGVVYVGAANGIFYALRTRRFKGVWEFRTGHQVNGGALVHGQAVYFGATDQFVYSLQRQDGRVRWKFRVGGAITGTPARNPQGSLLYIGAFDGRLYALPLT